MFTRLINYIKKWLVFIPIIHRYQPWDYSYYLELNRAALKLIEEAVFEKGHGLYTERQRRDIKTAQEALRRLIEDAYTNHLDQYYTVEESRNSDGTLMRTVSPKLGFKRAVENSKSRKKQDIRLFTSIFAKRILQWWD